MIEITEFGHINIVFSDVDEATEFYHALFGFELVQSSANFKNSGFAKSAGFLEFHDEMLLNRNFLKIPKTSIYIELMSYIQPASGKQVQKFSLNDLGDPRHIALTDKFGITWELE